MERASRSRRGALLIDRFGRRFIAGYRAPADHRAAHRRSRNLTSSDQVRCGTNRLSAGEDPPILDALRDVADGCGIVYDRNAPCEPRSRIFSRTLARWRSSWGEFFADELSNGRADWRPERTCLVKGYGGIQVS